MEGKKFDEDKLRWDLLPLDIMEDVVRVLTLGAKKYGPENWKCVAHAKRRYIAALLRHLTEYEKGYNIDDESGVSHLAHVITNGIFLLYFEKESV